MGLEHRTFGFRKDPYASRQVVMAGYGFGGKAGKVDYAGEFNRENSTSSWGLHAYASGLDVLRFYGFGNETVNTGDEDFFRVKANQYVLYPSFQVHLAPRTTFRLGPALRYTETKEEGDHLVNQVQPYGSGKFGELGIHGVLAFDGRDRATFTRRGATAALRGSLVPAAWDVETTYGQVNGDVAGYLSAGKALTLAVRVGGKKVFGDYPYQDAAVIGGGHLGGGALEEPEYTVRGFRARRFIGDASFFGNADLRLRVSRIRLILPGDWGLLGFADTGRVWLEGEDSDTWHTGVGGGFWMSFLNYRSTFSAGIAHSKEDDLVYFKGGFTF
jgi:hypothetical protein